MKTMKTMKTFVIWVIIFIPSILLSCKDDNVDNTKPTINLIKPDQNQIFNIGDEICLEAELSDDIALKSYKVDIHNNFDHHEHNKQSNAFNYNNNWDISGNKNTSIHQHIDIPEDATPGNYHFMIYCTDMSGNETHVARDIEIVNPL
jgi:hypothetical protein